MKNKHIGIAGLVAIVLAFEPTIAESHTLVRKHHHKIEQVEKPKQEINLSAMATEFYQNFLEQYAMPPGVGEYMNNLCETGKKIYEEVSLLYEKQKEEEKRRIASLNKGTIIGIVGSNGVASQEDTSKKSNYHLRKTHYGENSQPDTSVQQTTGGINGVIINGVPVGSPVKIGR